MHANLKHLLYLECNKLELKVSAVMCTTAGMMICAGLKKKGLKKRVRQPSFGRDELENAWKKPRLSNPLSNSKIVDVVGETIFDGQELVCTCILWLLF